jgi:hypothetical protein
MEEMPADDLTALPTALSNTALFRCRYEMTADGCVHGAGCKNGEGCNFGARRMQYGLLTGSITPIWSTVARCITANTGSVAKKDKLLKVMRATIAHGQDGQDGASAGAGAGSGAGAGAGRGVDLNAEGQRIVGLNFPHWLEDKLRVACREADEERERSRLAARMITRVQLHPTTMYNVRMPADMLAGQHLKLRYPPSGKQPPMPPNMSIPVQDVQWVLPYNVRANVIVEQIAVNVNVLVQELPPDLQAGAGAGAGGGGGGGGGGQSRGTMATEPVTPVDAKARRDCTRAPNR